MEILAALADVLFLSTVWEWKGATPDEEKGGEPTAHQDDRPAPTSGND
jgi:hypothetical protein